jgi:hypothetical protein
MGEPIPLIFRSGLFLRLWRARADCRGGNLQKVSVSSVVKWSQRFRASDLYRSAGIVRVAPATHSIGSR